MLQKPHRWVTIMLSVQGPISHFTQLLNRPSNYAYFQSLSCITFRACRSPVQSMGMYYMRFKAAVHATKAPLILTLNMRPLAAVW